MNCHTSDYINVIKILTLQLIIQFKSKQIEKKKVEKQNEPKSKSQNDKINKC